jgi:hypothetical protein
MDVRRRLLGVLQAAGGALRLGARYEASADLARARRRNVATGARDAGRAVVPGRNRTVRSRRWIARLPPPGSWEPRRRGGQRPARAAARSEHEACGLVISAAPRAASVRTEGAKTWSSRWAETCGNPRDRRYRRSLGRRIRHSERRSTRASEGAPRRCRRRPGSVRRLMIRFGARRSRLPRFRLPRRRTPRSPPCVSRSIRATSRPGPTWGHRIRRSSRSRGVSWRSRRLSRSRPRSSR